MAIRIDMPKLSDTMEEGVIASWNVEEGDTVSTGDVIAEVETDKATMDVEVFDDGTILKIVANEGDAVPLGQAIAIIGEEGEDISDLLDDDTDEQSDTGEASEDDEASADDSTPPTDEPKDPVFGDLEEDGDGEEETQEAPAAGKDGRIKASPLAKKMADEEGIDISDVKGSGPEGRIIKRDIEAFEPETEAKAEPEPETQPTTTTPAPAVELDASAEDNEIRISQMRKTIARRLAESKFTNPHYYETVDIDMIAAIEARGKLNEVAEEKISFNDLVVKASAVALKKHPMVNSSWTGDKIIQHGSVHVAVAVAVDEGLLTPVISNTDRKGLTQISKETKEMAGLARDKKLDPEQMQGSTFTISNLGMFGIEEFTAIINPPNACILAVGAIRDTPVVEDGEVVPGKRMKVTLSSDHRLVDGATAAQFLNTLRDLLEDPFRMLL